MCQPTPRQGALTLCLLTSALALAAPTAPDTTDPQESPADAAAVSSGQVSGRAEAAQSRAVDLLIEMQPRGAGLAFTDKARLRSRSSASVARPQPESPTRPEPPAAVTEALPATKAGLFGSGATPTVQSRAVTRPGPQSTAADTLARPGRDALSAGGETLPRWLMLPREFIAYVRENRGFVLGCIAGLLALYWVGSSLVSRRRA